MPGPQKQVLFGFLSLTLAGLAACGGEGSSAIGDSRGPDGGVSSGDPSFDTGKDAGAGADATGTAPQGRAAFCASKGGIPLPGTTDCTGDLAKKVFRFAACACDPLIVSGALKTHSFDSSTAASTGHGGSVGTNQSFTSSGSSDIGGALWAAGAVTLGGLATVTGTLHAGGGATVNGSASVQGDLRAGKPTAGAGLSVKGKTVIPASVPPPCDCGASIPIAKYVQAYAKDNDDAASGLSPTSLKGVSDRTVELPCGRYFFDEISTSGTLTLKLAGRTAVFVRGDVAISGSLDIQFAPGAELDLFVIGDLTFTGSSVVGDVQAPARSRFYVDGQVHLSGGTGLATNVYAPHATVSASGTSTVRGAIHAKSIDLSGGGDLAYDEAVLKVEGCAGPPAGGCKSCNDCPSSAPACNGGTCGACATSADCCAPLECQAGSCVPALR